MSLLRRLAAPVPPDVRHQVWVAGRAAAAARWLRNIPEAVAQDIFPGIDGLSITMAHVYERRGLPYGDAYVLSLLTAYLAPDQIFEIGTGTGRATLAMLRQAPEAHADTLDLGAQETAALGTTDSDPPIEATAIGEAFRDSPYANSIEQHLGDSATFDFSPFEGKCDLVFVDGAHTRDYVAWDSATALRLVRPGATIIWDDCHLEHAGVPQALNALRQTGRDVRRLISSRLAVLRIPAAGTPPQSA